MSNHHHVAKTHDFRDLAGAPPVAYGGGMYDSEGTMGEGASNFVKPGPGSKGLRTSANSSASGFNLRGVAEVLTQFGLDPTVELCRVLQGTRVITDRSGRAVTDEQGNMVTEPIIDVIMRTKVLMELQQFIAPKLKAIEVTHKGPELTDSQLDARLAALLAKAAVNG